MGDLAKVEEILQVDVLKRLILFLCRISCSWPSNLLPCCSLLSYIPCTSISRQIPQHLHKGRLQLLSFKAIYLARRLEYPLTSKGRNLFLISFLLLKIFIANITS